MEVVKSEKPKMVSSIARTVLVCGGLSIFGLLTLNLDNYFPNNAYEAMESFLETRIRIKGTEEEAAFIDSIIWSFFATLPLVSLIPATIVTPYLSDTLGRKYCILIFLAGAAPGRLMEAISYLPNAWPLLFIGRFLSSFAGNAFMVLLPILITEVCEGKTRSVVGSLQTVSFVSGAFLGIVLGLESVFGATHIWPRAYFFILTFGLLGIPIAFYMKESPEFLASKGKKREKLEKSLIFYHGNADKMDEIMQSAILDRLMVESHGDEGEESMIWQLFTDPVLRIQTIVSIFVSISYYPIYQLNFFSTFLFLSAGYSNTVATYCTVGLKATALVTTVVCSLSTDQQPKRRLWYLFSVWGAAIASTFMIICQIGVETTGPKPVVEGFEGSSSHNSSYKDRISGMEPMEETDPQAMFALSFAVATFFLQVFLNLGIRPVFWIVIPELFPYQYRATAKSLSLFIYTIVSIIFCAGLSPTLTLAGGYAYLMIALPLWISAIITQLYLPETGGKEPAVIFQEMSVAQTPMLSRSRSPSRHPRPTYGSLSAIPEAVSSGGSKPFRKYSHHS